MRSGRFRTTDNNKPINPESDYTTARGRGHPACAARAIVASHAVNAEGARRGFVRQLFQYDGQAATRGLRSPTRSMNSKPASSPQAITSEISSSKSTAAAARQVMQLRQTSQPMKTTTRRQFLARLGLSAAALPFLPPLPSPSRGRHTSARRSASSSCSRRTARSRRSSGRIGTGAELQTQAHPRAARTVQEPPDHPEGHLKQGPRRWRRPHARDELPAHRHRAASPATSRAAATRRPAGRSGISIDQEIKELPAIEAGHSDPLRLARISAWRCRTAPIRGRAGVYAGPNQPVAPLNDPYQVFEKLYGQMKDRESLGSVLDEVTRRPSKARHVRRPRRRRRCSTSTRRLSARWRTDLQNAAAQKLRSAAARARSRRGPRQRRHPEDQRNADRPAGECLRQRHRPRRHAPVHQLASARPACAGSASTKATTASRTSPTATRTSQEKLMKINTGLRADSPPCAKKLDCHPRARRFAARCSINTTIVWTNELGKGNSHSHDNIPFVLPRRRARLQDGPGAAVRQGRPQPPPRRPRPRLRSQRPHLRQPAPLRRRPARAGLRPAPAEGADFSGEPSHSSPRVNAISPLPTSP